MAKTEPPYFDYIIVGSGLAGLQLALEFSSDSFFSDKKIALIDSDPKTTNDKTWCFWEKGNGKWDDIVSKTWETANFYSIDKKIKLSLPPHQYKMVKSIDFYNHAKNVLSENPNISFIEDSIIKIWDTSSNLHITGRKSEYLADLVFDSRIPQNFFDDKKSIKIQQHFKGYIIKTEKEIFNPEEFTMMDYRMRHQKSTSFIYILPLTTDKALVEYTFFTPDLVEENVYDSHLKTYISEILKIENFTILEDEKGNIPMTDFNFNKYHTDRITKIGTGGGWVKGSTGYSFKNTERKISIVIKNLKAGNTPSNGLFKKRFQFYDSIFLSVLNDFNTEGMQIFEKFYSKNKVNDIFEFLDEKSNFQQEVKIMSSLFSKHFILSLMKYLRR
ncbi:lycopene beta-cyclase [Flavobacteriaceae bacterium MAR_2010_188]|nr:lycopene beta-cyclase [Flavobacteriaceae bacterium MAR_2010_188]